MPTDEIRTIRIDGAADLAFVDGLLDELDRLWAAVPRVPEEDRLLFGLAVSEIATNIVEHSPPGTRIDALVSAAPSALSAELRDTAAPAHIDLAGAAMPGADAESGRGLALSRTVLDELEHTGSDAGNAWRMVRIIRPASA